MPASLVLVRARACARARRPASAPSSSSVSRVAKAREALAARAAVEPAADEPLDRAVELLGRHAPEERRGRSPRRGRGRRAGRCRRPAGACPRASRAVVPWKPRSPTQCWAQACGQPSRCRRSVGDLASPKRSSRCSISRPAAVFVSVTEKLQCGSPVQRDRAAADRVDVEREADLAELARPTSSTSRLGDARERRSSAGA